MRALNLQPDSPFHEIENLNHLDTAIVPAIYDLQSADRNIGVEAEDACTMASERVVGEEVASGRQATILSMLPDSAERRMSDSGRKHEGAPYDAKCG